MNSIAAAKAAGAAAAAAAAASNANAVNVDERVIALVQELTDPFRQTILELVSEVQRLTEENVTLQMQLSDMEEKFRKWTKAAAQKWQRTTDQVAEHDGAITQLKQSETQTQEAIQKLQQQKLVSSASPVAPALAAALGQGAGGAGGGTSSPVPPRRPQHGSPRPHSLHPHMTPVAAPPPGMSDESPPASPRRPLGQSGSVSQGGGAGGGGSGSSGSGSSAPNAELEGSSPRIARVPAPPRRVATGSSLGRAAGKDVAKLHKQQPTPPPTTTANYTVADLLESDDDDDHIEITPNMTRK